MLSTPTSCETRRPNSGHSSQWLRSLGRKTAFWTIASRQGPEPTAYWIASALPAFSSVSAAVENSPSA